MENKLNVQQVLLWIIGSFVVSGLRDPLGFLLGIRVDLAQEDTLRLLLSPETGYQFMLTMLYHYFFLLVTAMFVDMSMNRIVAHWGWRWAFLLMGPYLGMFIAFWTLPELGVMFVFSLCGLSGLYLRRHLLPWLKEHVT